jgi:hypothetical protein
MDGRGRVSKSDGGLPWKWHSTHSNLAALFQFLTAELDLPPIPIEGLALAGAMPD